MDFERAHMAGASPPTGCGGGSGGRGGNIAAEMSDSAIAARERYQRAIAAVGRNWPAFLSGVLHGSGLEEAERHLNLPQRSGKAVLGSPSPACPVTTGC